MRRSDFDYALPPERIAQHPAARRDGSRLLAVGPAGLEDRRFPDIVELVPEGAVVVVNDTRVIPARVHVKKDTGGAVELLFVERVESRTSGERWRCMARSHKPLRAGARLGVPGTLVRLVVAAGRDEHGLVTVHVPGPARHLFATHGELPLPPYIERARGATAVDRDRYQTVFARAEGAVAAPTAGLHFTGPILRALEDRGATIARLTLHVGPGTFAPVRADDLDDHRMHAERFEIPEETAALCSAGRPVVAVGTTCVRALESAATGDGAVAAGAAVTDLFIRPGHRFRAVDHLVTNFHLPESTLLMLVCAFAGYDRVLAAYRHAVDHGDYRFYSYGDAMYLSRADGP